MKKVLTRKIHNCLCCQRDIVPHTPALFERHYIREDGCLHTYDAYYHIRCHYYFVKSCERYAKFKDHCPHPVKMIETIYSYIPGEAVMEPDYQKCNVCGQHV